MSDVENPPQNPQRKIKIQHTPWEWIWKFGLSPYCHYCDAALTLRTATKDHLTPRCRGGSNFIENIVPCCLKCNQFKGTLTEEEYWVLLSTEHSGASTNSILKTALEDRLDENGLLKRVVRERERISWAWRNPVQG